MIELYKEKKILIVENSGIITYSDICDFFNKFNLYNKNSKSIYEIVIFHPDLKFDISIKENKKLYLCAGRILSQIEKGGIAFVGSSEEVFISYIQIESLIKKKNILISSFSTKNAAVKWMNKIIGIKRFF